MERTSSQQQERKTRSAMSAVALVVLLVVAGTAWAERAGPRPRVRYFDHSRCGVVVASYLPPRTQLDADLDGDGELEHYIGTWGGIERDRLQPGMHPPTLVRDALVYTSHANAQYTCVDLAAVDVDRDGDLDLVYAGHRELVILANSNGNLSVLRREAQQLPPEADPRIVVRGQRIAVESR